MFTNVFTIIYQYFWLTRAVSTDWKLANVTSSYRVNQKEDTENYRPVSMALILMKVMDQIMLGHHTAGTGQPGDEAQPTWV